MNRRAPWRVSGTVLFAVALVGFGCSRSTVTAGRTAASAGPGTASSNGGGASAGATTNGPGGGTIGTSGPSTSAAGTTGGTGCGLNAQLCNGACVVTLTNPSNCGQCGNACAADEVCASGVCSDPFSCPSGYEDCSQVCVDPFTDNANCGSCGNACGSGQGCSSGFCVNTVPLTGQAPSCTNGGPATQITTDAGSECAGVVAQITFRWAVCSCNTVGDTGLLLTDSFNSLFGPYVDGGLGGGLGANSNVTLAGAFGVGGSLWTDSTAGLQMAGGAKVGLELHDNGAFTALGVEGVGADAYINGDVTSLGVLTINGTLHVPSTAAVSPSPLVTYQGEALGPVTVPPPCDCSSSQLIDVASIVAYGSANNDDAMIGLDPTVFATGALLSATRLDLPCGSYYLDAIQANGTMTIAVHGHTALFIGGDVNPNGLLQITVDPQATLDLFIGGNLAVNGDTTFGSTLVPSQTRIYVAGSQLELNGNITLAGNFYAPFAHVEPLGNLIIYGSLFTGDYQTAGATEVHFDEAVLSAASECPDGGELTGTTPCQSCRDCGNQACVGGVCGSCSTSADCCAPLICQDGTCMQTIR